MPWHQLELEKAHIAYACVGIFSTFFSLLSLFVKERLYIGEATVASIAGLILGPNCLGWFDPLSWGDTEYITLEICRIVLCIQIVAVAVELPRKYMKKHWLSVMIFLLPVMTCGWLIVGLFIWVLIPHYNYADALLVSACVTATDPILAAAVVGKGKFAERVPGHLRNLLSAESGCNDGMAFPFIFLSLNMVLYPGNVHEVFKEWFLITILYECVFGCILGVVIGYIARKAVAFAEKKNLIDRESFLAIFIFIAFNSAGIGSMLGVDDLLVSFAAGTAFGWNGDFAKKTEESHVSTVIDLLLNLAFFVYFGAIVPWADFNKGSLSLNCWRLIILAIVIIFLRRVPAVVALKPFTPDVKTWREAFFCGHFGPIGVGAIFALILARRNLEEHHFEEFTPLNETPPRDHPHFLLLATIWPIVCFIVITSIIVHGSSVAVLTLGKRLNRMAITMSFTTTNTQDQGPTWMSRLQKLDKVSTSFSLQRVDTMAPSVDENLQKNNTIETSGIKVRPAGGAKRRKHKKKKRRADTLKKTLSRAHSDNEKDVQTTPERHRPHTEFLQLGKNDPVTSHSTPDTPTKEEYDSSSNQQSKEQDIADMNEEELANRKDCKHPIPTSAYQEGSEVIIEDQNGEVINTVKIDEFDNIENNDQLIFKDREPKHEPSDSRSVHSMESLRRRMTQYSSLSESGSETLPDERAGSSSGERKMPGKGKKKTYYSKDGNKRKVFAFQVDNLIVIENEEGEIIRRYRVKPHNHRPRSSSIVDKALSLVGIKPKDKTESTPEASASPVNSPQPLDLLVVEHDKKDPNSPLNDPEVENRVENKLTKILAKNSQKHGHTAISGNPAIAEYLEDEERSQDSEIDEDDDEDEDDEVHETEVEKRRRLAALGLSRRNESDEEE